MQDEEGEWRNEYDDEGYEFDENEYETAQDGDGSQEKQQDRGQNNVNRAEFQGVEKRLEYPVVPTRAEILPDNRTNGAG